MYESPSVLLAYNSVIGFNSANKIISRNPNGFNGYNVLLKNFNVIYINA